MRAPSSRTRTASRAPACPRRSRSARASASSPRARRCRAPISPRCKRNDLVFATGPAGTGKTYLAVAFAAACLESGRCDRLILSRPAVEAGERLGFLPGDMREKVDPYLRPLYDALYDVLAPERVERGLATGVIEIAPLAFMRGRTLSHAIIILDEAQNCTPVQLKMFLTRLGEESKMIVTGDPTQVDLPPGKDSGLLEAIDHPARASRRSTISPSPAPTWSAANWSARSSMPTNPLPRRVSAVADGGPSRKRSRCFGRDARGRDRAPRRCLARAEVTDACSPRPRARRSRRARPPARDLSASPWCSPTTRRCATLNRTWRGKDAPTNVLSFPRPRCRPKSRGLLGDVVLAYETTLKEASAQAIALRRSRRPSRGARRAASARLRSRRGRRGASGWRRRADGARLARHRRPLCRGATSAARGGVAMSNTPIAEDDLPDEEQRQTDEETSWFERLLADLRPRRGARSARTDRGRARPQQERYAERAGAQHAPPHPALRQAHGRGRHGAARRHHRG